MINERPLPPADWLAHVRRAEALGYATFLLRDHVVPDFFGDQYAPIAALMAAACATTTLRVGTIVIDNDYRHPAILAKELATLDLLSGGRLEIGLGAGWLQREYEQTGIAYDPPGTRIGRLAEALAVFKGLFADGPLTFRGEHYAIVALDGFPKPAQRPHPPILIGGGNRRILRLAGREANIVGLLTTSVATGTVVDSPDERLPAAIDQKLAWVREGAGDRFPDIELSLIPTIIPAADRQAEAERLIAARGWSGLAAADVLAMPSLLIGSEDEITNDLLARRDRYGFSYYIVADADMEAFAPLVARLAGQ